MRKPDPVEIKAVAIPVLAEAVAVLLFIGMLAVWSGIAVEWRNEHLSVRDGVAHFQRTDAAGAAVVRR
ncbi:hypothetical protein [Bradyrhizobium sp. 141]|uniref:hypothetical protein n=1 Tax=Bradyrhizobium sp. 141 TaxID=2782617 RepID=UPI001FFBE845|nr:hypothetical protein [Bradyrhizobium sp. 141]MCK1718890.1 hypothetical protein [Bradyrhizobium sp. 141]